MSTSPSSKSTKRPLEVRPQQQLDERERRFVKRLRNILDMKYNNFRATVLQVTRQLINLCPFLLRIKKARCVEETSQCFI